MKTFRLFDLAMQLVLMVLIIYISVFFYKSLPGSSIALVGFWQIISFLVTSWKYGKLNLRLIYFISLFIVFLPTYYDSDIITDEVYYNYICPIVAGYYLIVCIIEFRQIDKVIIKNKTI